MKQLAICLSIFMVTLMGCSKEHIEKYVTENVVIIVVDGPRYSETWGHPTRENIPYRDQLSHKGVLCNEFYNNGETYTIAGHTAITTGIYQVISNTGSEYPQHHSVFQSFVHQATGKNEFAKIIASKDKLEVLSDCIDPAWKGNYRPQTDCGVNGLGTGYRSDSVTFLNALASIESEQPRILMICFRDPDSYAHAGDSLGYIQGIRKSDEYIDFIWKTLQQNSYYRDRTALFVTNDHGRHSYNYISHGDTCNACRHIEFLALGPDFRQGYSCNTPYEQIDIAPTVAELLGFHLENAPGKVMWELF